MHDGADHLLSTCGGQAAILWVSRFSASRFVCTQGPIMAIVGYARVSTRDQDLRAQLEALKAAGAATIYREKVSGVRVDRPQLAKLMAALKPGDIVTVTKLDRLGRSTRELLNLIRPRGGRDPPVSRLHYCRRPDELRRQFCGVAPSSWRLYRTHTQGRQAC
jgi:Resolvase, N terminal domain